MECHDHACTSWSAVNKIHDIYPSVPILLWSLTISLSFSTIYLWSVVLENGRKKYPSNCSTTKAFQTWKLSLLVGFGGLRSIMFWQVLLWNRVPLIESQYLGCLLHPWMTNRFGRKKSGLAHTIFLASNSVIFMLCQKYLLNSNNEKRCKKFILTYQSPYLNSSFALLSILSNDISSINLIRGFGAIQMIEIVAAYCLSPCFLHRLLLSCFDHQGGDYKLFWSSR